jgi:hypothetical protein
VIEEGMRSVRGGRAVARRAEKSLTKLPLIGKKNEGSRLHLHPSTPGSSKGGIHFFSTVIVGVWIVGNLTKSLSGGYFFWNY